MRLYVQFNDLAGPIPPELGDLAQIEELSLRGNDLSGPVPPELSGLGALRLLDLWRNDLSGQIPAGFGGLTALQTLNLGSNELTGPIPGELANLSGLGLMDLSNNRLTGSIPPYLGSFPLWYLRLDGNNLTGAIPVNLGNLNRLDELRLSRNALTGPIPPSLGRLTRLNTLHLWANELTGPVPPQLGDLTELNVLTLSSNGLTGPIPRALGNLIELERLLLGANRLSGTIPAELGNLSRLHELRLSENLLSGPMPHELTRLALTEFSWHDTDLCAPSDQVFQAWLQDIGYTGPGPDCPPDLRSALEALFAATGGSAWTQSANWLTHMPVSSWHGTEVDDAGRLTGLDLRDNGLVGSLPRELGDLLDLRRLDLRENELSESLPPALGHLVGLEELYLSHNRFTGKVPAELANLSHLRALNLSHNRFSGALPGSFADFTQLGDFRWSDSGLCSPEAGWFQAWLRSIATHVGGIECSSPIRLSIPATHLTQAAQNLEGDVPLIAGRPALLRVFVTADRASGHRPSSRAVFFLDQAEVYSTVIELESPRGLPETPAPGQLDQSYNVAIPGEILVPGLEMVVDVDPDSTVPRATGSQDRVPAVGRLALDVLEVPPLDLTVVPVLAQEDPDSTILTWAAALAPEHPTIRFAANVLPVGDFTVSVRAPYVTSVRPQSYEEWVDLLQEIHLLRLSDGAEGHYFGAVGGQPSLVRGVAYVPGFTSIGEPDPDVIAHEIGHNMNLGHAPCGFGRQWRDPDYPYSDGTIGIWGYDFRTGGLMSPSMFDVMTSGCTPAWISDYSFDKALEYRAETETAARSSMADAAHGRRLLLWGGLSQDGVLRLDPAFVLNARARLPDGQGPYRIEGFGIDGARHFSLAFSLDELDHGAGSFLFAIPFEDEWPGSLDRIVLSGPEGTAILDGETHSPMAMMVHKSTGRLLAVLRDWEPSDAANTGTAADAEVEMLVSYGLPGA